MYRQEMLHRKEIQLAEILNTDEMEVVAPLPEVARQESREIGNNL